MLGHVRKELSAYCHGLLSAEEASRVSAHLEQCERCRKEYDEIKLGVALASHLPMVPAPDSLWGEIEGRLDEAARQRGEVRPGLARWGLAWRAMGAFAGFLVAAFGAGSLWYYQFRERLRIEVVSAAPSPFESAAREAHLRRLAGGLEFDFVTGSPEHLRGWVEQRTGLLISLPDRRPAEDQARFQLLGAKIIAAGGAQAALIGYQMDSRPVTLVAARLGDLAEAPEERWLRKDVSYRFDAATGLKLLTWGADGLAYVLVSDLPELGTESCLLCHVAPERRKLIRAARPRS